MARELAETEEAEPSTVGGTGGDTDGNDGLLHRREYLRLASVASVSAASLGVAGTAAADDDFRVIRVPAGQRRVIHVENNETFENVIFDQTARGASASLVAHGTNWTVRNVAWRGEFSHRSRAFTCSDRGGNTSYVENVYIGDGVQGGVGQRRHPQMGIWVAPEHSGHIEFDGVYVEGAHDNGFYASAPGTNSNGRRGTVHFKNCYAKDNWVSHFRLAGGVVENCVAVNSSRGRNGRCIWVWPTRGGLDVTIRNCHFISGSYAHGYDFGRSGGTTRATVIDSHYAPRNSTRFQGNVQLDERNVGHNPRDFVPEGCPDSVDAVVENAGSETPGEPRGDPSEYREHTLLVRGDHQGRNWEPTHYSFEVDGELEASTYDGATIDPQLSLSDGRVENTLANWKDAYAFDGELRSLEVDGPAYVYLDGERVDPAEFGDGDEGEDENEHEDEGGDEETHALENVILIDGDESGVTRYEFVVSGDVEKSTYQGASIDDEDVIEDDRVHGVVANWKDAFRFGGDLEELTVDGPATVYVNDEVVEPSEFGDDLPHTLEVVGRSHPSSFQISIDGSVELEAGDPNEEVTTITDGVIESTVDDDSLRFAFSGTLTDVTFVDSEADIYVNGERIDPYEYGDQLLLPHAIVIDGTEADGPSTYSFTVDGEVLKSEHMGASIDPGDVIEGTAVRGGVANWLDAFWFSGDITDFKLLGDAKVHVEYNARDQ
ncbi:right-handed parallel beta-helix repeat-containing protein [Natronobiforma cellulositropha]|uniref:right-handed parallel beta-helix repeat-containing protein n=1 Tax=Natronobiforma cellulositropha TaxID=1679076 RepID=UPI0021D5E91F|nr:right-handed parallel beta-helix repeat-containing protein [Natronobiforma cellulositropha]